MSKQDLIAAIESRLDTIEGLLDELEDNQVHYVVKCVKEYFKF